MIKIKNVSLTIKRHKILQDINIDIAENEIVGLVGRNGSGKTMLMKAICGFVLPSSGEVIVDNDIIGVDIDFPRSIGIIIEHPCFFLNKSGIDNLKLLSKIKGIIDDDKIKTTMKIVGLDYKDIRPVKKYSLGMKQRLGIAQAIMEEPKILLLDEPFNGLDEDGVNDMRTFLQKYKNDGHTIVLCSHAKEDINILCDVIYRIDKGMIIEKIVNKA